MMPSEKQSDTSLATDLSGAVRGDNVLLFVKKTKEQKRVRVTHQCAQGAVVRDLDPNGLSLCLPSNYYPDPEVVVLEVNGDSLFEV